MRLIRADQIQVPTQALYYANDDRPALSTNIQAGIDRSRQEEKTYQNRGVNEEDVLVGGKRTGRSAMLICLSESVGSAYVIRSQRGPVTDANAVYIARRDKLHTVTPHPQPSRSTVWIICPGA